MQIKFHPTGSLSGPRSWPILLLAGAVFLNGCSERNDPVVQRARQEAEVAQSYNSLGGTAWALLEGADLPLPQPDRAPTLQFAEDGKQLSGFAGVNRFSGTYVEGRRSIRLGPLTVTKMAGSPILMEAEQSFLQLLTGEMKFVRSGEILLLESSSGKSATFRRLSEAELAGSAEVP